MSRPSTHSRSTTQILPRTHILLLLALCAAGCRDVPSENRPVLVRDSAGVTIVANYPAAPDSRLPWSFGEQPSLSIGTVEGDGADQLFRVVDATRLADGRIVVANAGTNELRVFHPDGSHAATAGGRGEGPGEFVNSSPTAVAPWPGDSVAAPNPWGARLSIFDGDGNHGRDVSLARGLLNVVGHTPDGRIFASGTEGLQTATATPSDLARSATSWAILAGDGSLLADLGQYPGDEWWAIRAADGSIQGGRPHPFGRTTVGAVWGDLAVIGVQDRYELKAFTADGTLARIVRRTGELARPTRADLVDYHARLYAPWPEEERAQLLKDLDDMPLVDAHPAFGAILADRAGHLWVREHSQSGDGNAPWTVYDPEGRIQGLAETPPGLDVFEIGADYILGRGRDDLGVEYVQLWTLVREAGGAIGSTDASP